ncbi:MAG: hypothetical protein GFH27_549291n228 [Chloroflexi bacterium AL-W]|nr:hypothetical protein [Chloroflexi bacterium AL-N1]NOK67304.1 hypothetical protein [Chloroflexi bacterium AL-N10]NOK75202.1 hypothetical protein [Chloroflexi bacterium AL-N5]NOK81990.1 hypothetical protein [Chloroflexi bacterium AL-W]NOK89835.1 hypothetical protein [Chloroflexi bacterium AL-N15]
MQRHRDLLEIVGAVGHWSSGAMVCENTSTERSGGLQPPYCVLPTPQQHKRRPEERMRILFQQVTLSVT